MDALLVVSVADDTELDRVTLDDEGRVTYRTGAARDLVESWRARLDLAENAGDAELLDALAGWSNGYVAVRPAGDAGEREDQDDDEDGAGGEPAAAGQDDGG